MSSAVAAAETTGGGSEIRASPVGISIRAISREETPSAEGPVEMTAIGQTMDFASYEDLRRGGGKGYFVPTNWVSAAMEDVLTNAAFTRKTTLGSGSWRPTLVLTSRCLLQFVSFRS